MSADGSSKSGSISLGTISILGILLTVVIVVVPMIPLVVELSKIERRYVLTTLAEYPEELHRFGTVLHVDKELVQKILSPSVQAHANLSAPTDATVVVEVSDIRVTFQDMHVYAKPKTVCLGPITPACYARMGHEEMVVLLGSEEVGHVRNAVLEIPELTPIIARANGVNIEQATSTARTLLALATAVAAIFIIVAYAHILLPKRPAPKLGSAFNARC